MSLEIVLSSNADSDDLISSNFLLKICLIDTINFNFRVRSEKNIQIPSGKLGQKIFVTFEFTDSPCAIYAGGMINIEEGQEDLFHLYNSIYRKYAKASLSSLKGKRLKKLEKFLDYTGVAYDSDIKETA